ncbi:MAG: allophanate hydrolase [Alphaproteobacteria bacterium]
MLEASDSLDVATLGARLRAGAVTPAEVVEGVLARIAARGDDKVWINLVPRDELLARAAALAEGSTSGRPLYGIPFAIKDNIDLAGHPTTAACPDFAYRAEASAAVVERLLAAGAVAIGKCNLDQFATGLNGTRSPYGAPACVFHPDHIAGGSSSGSAVAVAAGLVSFALGTDTAGSGRVPAAFNNIVGVKPTRGLLSVRGVVPACRSLDCVSILALTAEDARDVLDVAKGFDAADPFSRHEERFPQLAMPRAIRGCRFGVPRPEQLEFFDNVAGAQRFVAMLRLIERLGGTLVEVDLSPFLEVARLLYDGPWIAERYAAIRDFVDRQPASLHPVTREVIAGGAEPRAADAFLGYYRLKALRRLTSPVWEHIHVLLTPTAGRLYKIAELLAEPVRLNSNLGYYTNFVNLLDLSAIAVPAGFEAGGLPFGVTLVAPAWCDDALTALGGELHRAEGLTLGATGHAMPPRSTPAAPRRAGPVNGLVRVAVCGAHMSGLALNHQLVERGARLVRRCRTAGHYRLYALPGGPPARPGLVRSDAGSTIEVEVWEMPTASFGSFVEAIPAPLGIGTLELDDGERVKGFLCEAYAAAEARDITDLASWRRYLAAQDQQARSQQQ